MGVEHVISWLAVGGASNWATEAGGVALARGICAPLGTLSSHFNKQQFRNPQMTFTR